ncbi:hypothetical protein CXB51_035317 [Gossypium anomalum]|uniref:Uncharacterized protein n=1 Tax=Gossypium anomalum TaxID=47600 RepID=A0A8J5Y135_9ROSI|nr:hypothetical protein CXB51_035317 [Gossypium anomalum]
MFAVPVVLSIVFTSQLLWFLSCLLATLVRSSLLVQHFANSWAIVTGFTFMTGLSGALETLCGQGFGAKMYKMLGIYLQASCIISFFFLIIISVLWSFTEPILPQSIAIPLVVFSVVPLGIHFGIVYSLVNKKSVGYKGAPMAASISIWISFLLLDLYVLFANKFQNTWNVFSFESFRYIIRNSKLALTSAAMIW